MTNRTLLASLCVLAFAAPAQAETRLGAGIWTNTEDVYFAEEEGREKAEWKGFEVSKDGQWREIDAFGKPVDGIEGQWIAGNIPGVTAREDGGWQVGESELRRADPFSCWVSVRKFAADDDGSPAWTYQRDLPIFNQGGRVRVEGNGDAPDVTFRMRNVTWAQGSTNRPALVLYVHKDDPVRAESYSWASPNADMVGINLRWVQGSCSRDAASDRQASLEQAGMLWQQTISGQDWEALRALYTDDAVLMTHGQAKIEGADAILSFLQRVPNAGGSVDFEFNNEEVVVDGDYGTVTATYLMTIAFPGRDPIEVAGRSLLIYKWVDGEWLLWRDMDNQAPDATVEAVKQ